MNELLIGYARVSIYEQDLTAQRVALERLRVEPAYVFTDANVPGNTTFAPTERVRFVTPDLSKGQEFDLVAILTRATPGAAVDRYVAKIRANQQLVIVER